MMIVVEGMDNTGKTTLVSQLREKYLFPVLVSSRYYETENRTEKWVRWIYKMMELSRDEHIIFDRFPLISEHVYGPILRGKNVLAEHPAWPDLLGKFGGLEPLIIYCRPPMEHVLNWRERPQMGGVKEQSEKLLKAYDEAMRFFWPTHYDYTHPLALSNVYHTIDRRIRNGQH